MQTIVSQLFRHSYTHFLKLLIHHLSSFQNSLIFWHTNTWKFLLKHTIQLFAACMHAMYAMTNSTAVYTRKRWPNTFI